jgi:glycosyltransferase involved in cell wall biosynthesis
MAYTICTSISRRGLPLTRVLAGSVVRHAPEADLVVLVVDGPEGCDGEPYSTLSLSDIGLGGSLGNEMRGIYSQIELEHAVRPWLVDSCLAKTGRPVVFLDPSCELFGSLEALARAPGDHEVAVSPHVLEPLPRDGLLPDEAAVLAWGIYDPGCMAVGARSRGGPFLEFWKEHCYRRESLLEQRWLDFVHCFPHVLVDDPSYDVAFWNAWGRPLTRDNGRVLVNGEPLRLFQFRGFDPEMPELLSVEQQTPARVLLGEHQLLADLCRQRAEFLLEAGYQREARIPYAWRSTPYGTDLNPAIRATYLSALTRQATEESPVPGPFDDDGGAEFAAWLESLSGSTGVPPYLSLLCDTSLDLSTAFPNHRVDQRSAESLCEWIHNRTDPRAIKARNLIGESFELPPGDPSSTHSGTPEVPPPAVEGLNVIGYHHAEDGIGQAGRLVAAAAGAAGVSCTGYSLRATPSSLFHRPDISTGSEFGGDTNLFCVGINLLGPTIEQLPPAAMHGRKSASLWFWETDRVPPHLLPAFDLVDEVWAGSSFTKGALDRAGKGPVRVLPLPVPIPSTLPSLTRRELGLPEGFLVFFMFSWLSVLERKNPEGVIDAFIQAFEPKDGAHLVIKSHGEVRGDARSERLRLRSSRPDIHFLDGHVRQNTVWAMLNACDCFISLHRSEGFGLTMAEAMALGKPVVATGWSGNLDFMDERTAYLMPATLSPIPEAVPVYGGLGNWAEPDLAAATFALRQIYEDPTSARKMGTRARDHMQRTRSPAVSGRVLARYLNDLHGRSSRT